MTDRELLERAAMAAGIDVRWYGGGCLRVADKCNGFAGNWNPLVNDGDALRLAVRLKLEGVAGEVWATAGSSINDYERDPCAATRRAIVRAAAEMCGVDHA